MTFAPYPKGEAKMLQDPAGEIQDPCPICKRGELILPISDVKLLYMKLNAFCMQAFVSVMSRI